MALPAGSLTVIAPCRVQNEHWHARTCSSAAGLVAASVPRIAPQWQVPANVEASPTARPLRFARRIERPQQAQWKAHLCKWQSRHVGIVVEHIEEEPLAFPQLEHLEHPQDADRRATDAATPASA